MLHYITSEGTKVLPSETRALKALSVNYFKIVRLDNPVLGEKKSKLTDTKEKIIELV